MASPYDSPRAAMPLTLLLILVLIPVSVLTFFFSPFNPLHNTRVKTTAGATNRQQIHLHNHLQIQQLRLAHSHCEGTLYKELCVATLSSFQDLHKKSMADIISATLNLTVDEAKSSASNCSDLAHGGLRRGGSGGTGSRHYPISLIQKRALDDCIELLDETVDELRSAISDLLVENGPRRSNSKIQTLLSAAMTDQYTCLEGLGFANKTLRKEIVQPRLMQISHHVSNALVLLNKAGKRKKKKMPGSEGSSQISDAYDLSRDGFPRWMSRKDRRLLQTSVDQTKYDLVVAKDGSGNFTTIGEAVEGAPAKSTKRFVIYIKAGTYLENVEVKKKKRMLMFLGDGIEKTVVKASRNVVDGWTTFRSATVAVVGAGFIAKGMTFENSAGPEKHQAVALRSDSDLSAFYQCSFVGYQDTLYTHSLRQFYRECDIYGTVDFIFGNAAVVFQRCNLYARKPREKQKNILTAQGREDPNQNTGISILDCKVAAAADLVPVKSSFETYLGRPWREYSRTVYMLSYIDDLVNPVGWLEWSGDFALKTLYYGEYRNIGPGSNTSSRVKWPGYRVINNSSEASQFTVGNFIEGAEWLPSYQIPHDINLPS